ncbi:MAG: putative maltokinase, partial [Acidobacteria bacterium]|nr:putative maltokinase [Acidobacteriota bacterium]
RQRWFGEQSRTIQAIDVADSVSFRDLNAALLFLEVTDDDKSTNVYLLPLAITVGEESERIRAAHPLSIIAEVVTDEGGGVLHDGVFRESVRQAMLSLIEGNGKLRTRRSVLEGRRSGTFSAIRGIGPLPGRTGSAQQSNTSILYGTKLILKLFRRLQPGQNPDTEIGRFLTETAHFTRIPAFLGEIRIGSDSGEPTTVAMLQALVENEGDGWETMVRQLSDYYESVSILPLPDNVAASAFCSGEQVGPYLCAAALLATRTAEMHLALATPTDDPAFAAEPFTANDLSIDAQRIESQLSLAFEALKRSLGRLSRAAEEQARVVLGRREELAAHARVMSTHIPADYGQRIRIHGDYHLGQILCSQGDYTIIDFEGEPARTLAARRAKQSPLKDVAGMLRSFSYASHAALNAFLARSANKMSDVEPWRRLWENAVAREFLRAYQSSIQALDPRLIPQPANAEPMLDAYLLEKVLYELRYELDNRQSWVGIPLSGILNLLE